jgi:carbon-monoxide dehydrogenase large subunit
MSGSDATPIGVAQRRREDPRFVTGRGRYIDDLSLPGMLHAAFVRSPHPHARIRRIDPTSALAVPGVVAVATGRDLAQWTRPLTVGTQGVLPMTMTALPVDKVRFVGDPVAVVVATDRYAAEDAAARVMVEYEPLPAVADFAAAVVPGAPPVDDDLPTNLICDQSFEYGDPAAAFAAADTTVEAEFHQHRQTHAPLETRGCIAAWDLGRQHLTLYESGQVPHPLRTGLAARLGLSENQVRVVMPDVGGGFGQKIPLWREQLSVCALSRRLGQPIKWIEDRRENLTAACMAREESVKVRAAVGGDGKVLALEALITSDFGAYAFYPGNYMMRVVGMLLPGPYDIRHYRYRIRVAVTNKCPAGPMRAPMAITTWVTEGTMDAVARRLGLDPVAVRRANLIPDEQPYRSVTGELYEALSSRAAMKRALERIRYEAFRAEQPAARAQGRLTGIGVANVVESTTYGSAFYRSAGIPGSGHETAVVQIEPSGAVRASVGIMNNGQGYETTIAQTVAAGLGVSPEVVAVRLGDTDVAPYGMGTRGARGAVAGAGTAYLTARALRDKVLAIAGHLLEASPDDLRIADGRVTVTGAPDRGLTLGEVARTAYLNPLALPRGMEPGLTLTKAYDPPPMTYSNATHACVVEIDPDTGAPRILRYVVVEDAGTLINPMVVDGQILGATAMALSGTLLEQVVYAPDGQNLTGTFMDYALATASDVPAIEIEHIQTPNPRTPLGLKGMAEGGVMGAIAAVAGAVQDALVHRGVTADHLPLSPARILTWLQAPTLGGAQRAHPLTTS